MAQDKELASFRFQTDRGKTFFFDVKENDNGRFLKITESRPRRGDIEGYIRNFMTIPEAFLTEFIQTLSNTSDYLEKENSHA